MAIGIAPVVKIEIASLVLLVKRRGTARIRPLIVLITISGFFIGKISEDDNMENSVGGLYRVRHNST
ncbi:hypothetical protein BMS84_08990 [Leuconostoc pseudomesenteroides]|nr:hypothetical protein BMS84_08990 [Leuconostoc pseudomesenteroides]